MKMKSCSQIGIAIVFTALAVVTIMDRRAKQPHTVQAQTVKRPGLSPSAALLFIDPELYPMKLEHVSADEIVYEGHLWQSSGRGWWIEEKALTNGVDGFLIDDILNGPNNFP